MCRLYGKFAVLWRVLCKTRLIFPLINGPNVTTLRFYRIKYFLPFERQKELQFWPLQIHYVSYLLCVLWHTRPSFIFTYLFIYSFIYLYFLYNTVGSVGDGYSKNPWLRTWVLRTCQAPSIYKNLFSLKFETGSYFVKCIKKYLYTSPNEISQYSESSLEA